MSYPRTDVTVDLVVFGLTTRYQDLQVLLIQRAQASQPFCGSWALPGGFISGSETLAESARRTLKRETGLSLSYLEQLYTFGDPGRDPRGRVISVCFLGLVRPDSVALTLTHPATADVRWWSIDTTPALAFDHRDLIDTALQRLRSKVAWQPIGVDLLPERFTLSDLQGVYELILGRRLDKRNFRRKINKLNVLVATDQFQHDSHRPAQLFRFDKDRYDRLCAAGIAFEL